MIGEVDDVLEELVTVTPGDPGAEYVTVAEEGDVLLPMVFVTDPDGAVKVTGPLPVGVTDTV